MKPAYPTSYLRWYTSCCVLPSTSMQTDMGVLCTYSVNTHSSVPNCGVCLPPLNKPSGIHALKRGLNLALEKQGQ